MDDSARPDDAGTYEPAAGAAPPRRLRADARRSIDAILNAARTVVSERPDASMEEIAAAAGVSRQTVYAHFPSRDALLAALVEAAAADYSALLDEAGLDTAPPADALVRFLGAGWRFVDRYPLVLNATANRIPRPEPDPHDVVPPRLERLIRRGQQEGDFDPRTPASWLTAAVFGLQHTAAEQVASGRLTAEEAEVLCRDSALRLCGGAG
ncbi:TetR/AcrR family transcriptional regulator [Actinacidiphila bryophytorum]|uniref:HTH tetR-type domain-containing protein n=1 Tax=Actinacidiphila bryophytorum TaxID=1436133 RepID=A0A9W4MDU2_9ACTN|nr:TetR/AcrR family transcriptional regulator [Actinacidiphila bryophytorum]MBM9437339.1 TetR/AcrR family transcriptional regulator [Actinacidiphila bryophytorum]MBN6541740.1 TetR/AcrR family transcriptional regulator [Actinacidiphila bryophytorum]CAG7651691.1 HTH tetR-type domain-containing protein [Actinacidiphila bryophytorum]